MRTVIVGRGAVGSSVAYNLRREEVVFAVDEERHYRSQFPLLFNGEKLSLPVIVPRAKEESADLIIVAVKNFSLHSALSVIRPFVGENTTILPLLNGIEAERILGNEFGKEKVLYAFISGLSVVKEGNTITSFSRGRITMGEENGERTERLERVYSFLSSSGQDTVIAEDIIHDKWVKFMTNTCFNTLTAILEADYEGVSNNGDIIRAARLIAREVQLVAMKSGVALTQEDVETMIQNTCSLTGKGRSSMLEDVLMGRETENRYFCGAVARMGKELSIPTPYCDMLAILLEAKRHVRECN